MKVIVSIACYCPFCRSEVEISPQLIRCSDCKTLYHPECWNENRGCSVFGCTGIRKLFPTTPDFEDREPGWLMFLRIVVFGFIPYAVLTMSCQKLAFFPLMGCFGMVWFLLFLPCLPILFGLEVLYLKRVLRNPALQARYGDRAYHIISLSAYGIAVVGAFVVLIQM